MNKEIICVFQDCPLCGDKGKKLKKLIIDKKLNVRKISFASPEGKELCYKAVVEHKIGTMPFFTDGNKFSTKIVILSRPCCFPLNLINDIIHPLPMDGLSVTVPPLSINGASFIW